MTDSTRIPVFALYGETEPFPDPVHCEAFSARAPIHNWRISAHRHARLAQLFLIAQGRVAARVEQEDLELASLQFLYVPPLSVHQFRFVPGTSGQVVSFTASVAEGIAPPDPGLRAALSAPVAGGIGDSMSAVASQLQAVLRDRDAFRMQCAVGLAQSLLCMVAGHAHSARPVRRGRAVARLRRLDELIAAHMAHGWTASEFASEMAISTGHLSRLCRAATGVGASAYIERAAMKEACRLLAFTKLPVSEISYRLGYSDPSYFTKRFRKSQGATPSAYRAQLA